MSAAAGGAASGAAADAAAADPTKFDPHILVSRFRTCKEHLHDIPIKEFVDGCDEIKKIVCALFGTARARRSARATPPPDRRTAHRPHALQTRSARRSASRAPISQRRRAS